ncbi:hypothetical protein K1719_011206 [Acacia pycnantha]|nr:hypothetical protein K1719_011206 [Acacia pycnantha]
MVCVTGASGYIASWLVKFLLLRGYTVKGTVRDPNDSRKVDHLFKLDGAKERLRLIKADLQEEGSFDQAVEGCEGVFHTASPVYFDPIDPQTELIDPAVKGTLNVLKSCAKSASVKRAILTSSFAAVLHNGKPLTPDVVIDETWFSSPDICRDMKRWYVVSKILAEEAAWKFVKENSIDLVVLNPAFVIGPLLQPSLNETSAMILKLTKGQTFPNYTAGWILHELFPTLQLPDKCADDKPFRSKYQVSKEKAKTLGIEFIPLEVSLKETVESLKEKHFINF